MTTRTDRLTVTELNDALHDYLSVVIANEAVQAVAEADPIEIGYEVCETYEHKHGSLSPFDDGTQWACIEQLVGLGETAIAVCAALVKP